MPTPAYLRRFSPAMVLFWLCVSTVLAAASLAAADDDPPEPVPLETESDAPPPAAEPVDPFEATEQPAIEDFLPSAEPQQVAEPESEEPATPEPVPAQTPEPAAEAADLPPPVATLPNDLPTTLKMNPAAPEPRATIPSTEPDTAAAHDADAAAEDDLLPASFNGLRPGESTLADVQQTLGDPQETLLGGGQLVTYIYAVEPFERIEIVVEANVVTSLMIELSEAVAPEPLLAQLGLEDERPAIIRDSSGLPLGMTIPERGVLLSFVPHSETPAVKQVVLEPIDPQAFVARAEAKLLGPYKANLADLDRALTLDPRYARAHWLRGVLLLRLDHAKEAEVSAARAVALDASQPHYLLTWARALARQGRYDQAESETRKVLESTDLPPVVRAAAYAQLGDLALQGPAVDTQSAIKHHTAAIRLAAPLAGDRVTGVRRLASATLIEAHLGVAGDIAWGDWRGKPEAIAQWTDRAADYVEQSLIAEDAGALLVLDVACDVLAAHASLRGATDGGIWLEEARDAAEVVLSESDDSHLATEVHWKLALCYYHALQIAHARGDVSESEQYGEAAVENMRQLASLRALSAEQNHLIGRIFFQLGAVQAVHRQDHREAVRWYDKAAPQLTEPVGASLLSHVGWHGEALVSMGVSYWEVDRRNEAIAFTERGAQLIAQAVQQRAFLEEALRVPYGNLAAMHRQAGDTDRAQEFAELARRPSAALGR